ncbi:GNAT family N-acetyltransferase [Brucella anthropi]|jgi:ribosomal protein S18 acetylase RimI-like enzyme|uniref:GNAT family N-acetyltransferase n=2 Tax=Brucella anthropi TaxID=529 RepID=A0A011UJI3_BRUAN|nr:MULTISPECIES: GNAT family N-acetyltransferase [Brucella/Ochrobactrum group]MCR5943555.1 GNAT family N-acetyltransferase [Ochrobactrum sp. XJ1]QTN04942.1 GNAT family N-acetyltransferase [Ochrobactrum sp. EEELCW01]EXL06058.1 GNAT family acetyltransferase [Brucella anthropi]KAB2740357.1 GNAT family N-acetyltransferase [Brucella anthropi]KAB2748318.1 GNAT family N-acetyltransferase [Brucella anthropi]
MAAEAAIAIRKAAAADVAAIIAMLADDALGAQREDASLPLRDSYRSAFAAIDADPNQLLAVVEHDGEIIGCMQISFIPGLSRMGMWRGQIESVRIASHIRGGGVGRQMIVWAIEQCRERGCGLVQLTTDKSRSDALRFYQSLGFTDSHEGLKLSL